MQRRSGPYRLGDRYLLQYPGGVERLAEVGPEPTQGGEPVLRPLLFDDPLPPHVLPGGEWLLEPGERLVRDWAGCHWSVTAAPAPPEDRLWGALPAACHIHFTRWSPSGERTTYRAASLWRLDELGEAELVAMLRDAWRTMDADPEERRRRSWGPPGATLEL